MYGNKREAPSNYSDQNKRMNTGGMMNGNSQGGMMMPMMMNPMMCIPVDQGGRSGRREPRGNECFAFIERGSCKFGDSCKFDHPGARGGGGRGDYGGGRGRDSGRGAGSTACFEFLETGSCKYGSSCKFDHPSQGSGRTGPTGLPINPGAQNCKFYMDNGKCKFGVQCKFNHPVEALQEIQQKLATTQMGPHGLPLRPDAEECYMYREKGHCRFGQTCKFHHPVTDGQGYSNNNMMPANDSNYGAQQRQVYPSGNMQMGLQQQYGQMSGSMQPQQAVPQAQAQPVVQAEVYNPFEASPTPAPAAQPVQQSAYAQMPTQQVGLQATQGYAQQGMSAQGQQQGYF